jgi:rhamnose transport system substrate-binding protein
MSRLCGLLVTTVLVAVLATACGGTGSSPTANSSGCATKPVTVGFVPKTATDSYFHEAMRGAQVAQQELGGDLVQDAPDTSTPDAQIPFIESMISRRVGVIAISSNGDAIIPAIRKAQQAGIKVITYDSPVDPSAGILFVNQADTDSIGKALLENLGELINYSGEYVIISSTPTAGNQNAWIAAIKKYNADAKYAGMKLDNIAYGQEQTDINTQQANAMMQAYPNVKGMIVPAGLGFGAVTDAVRAARKLGQIKITGLAPVSKIRPDIQAGRVGDVWWHVGDLGYLTYYTAQLLAQCKIQGNPNDSFTAGKLGKYTVTAEKQVILGPAVPVTAANESQFNF